MICGVGIDIVEIKRIKRAIERSGDAFINRIFTDKEIEYCKKQRNPYQHFAARFAAKESVLKAFGLGWNSMPWKTMEIVNDEFQKPRVILYGKFEELMKEKRVDKIHCSLSHFGEYAVAIVIAESHSGLKTSP